MALPSSGIIKLSQVITELGKGNGFSNYQGMTWYMSNGSSGVFSNPIKLSDFYSKLSASPTFSFTISGSKTDVVLRTEALNAGWDGKSELICTVASSAICIGSSTSKYGLTISGSYPKGLKLINDGKILGKGGTGGRGVGVTIGTGGGTYSNNSSKGTNGGTALRVTSAVNITNNGTIAGGGGGGGGGEGLFIRPVSTGGSGEPGYKGGGSSGLSQAAGMYGGGGGGGGAGSGAGGAGGAKQAGYAGSAGATGGAGNTSSGGTGGQASGMHTIIKATTTGSGKNQITKYYLVSVPVAGGRGASGGAFGAKGADVNTSNYPVVDSSTISTTSGSAVLKRITSAGGTLAKGGSGGAAVSGNSNITWAKAGTRTGAIT